MLSRLPLRPGLKRLIKIMLSLLLILMIIIASGIAFIEIQRHRTVALPTPSGPFAVGRMEYDWTDQSRIDPFAPHTSQKRELVVWSWYPATRVPGAQTAPYLPAKWGQANDNQIVQSDDSIQTHSVDHAPLSNSMARYPVLIFEPGMGKIPTQYTTLLEDLASHGYIIFAINPTYSSDVVVFPDGRVAESTTAGKIEDSAGLQAADRIIQVWAQDEIFTINQIDKLNAQPGDMFNQHLDLTRLGLFGHSFGGATAAQVCHLDARCKAGIDIDGDLFGNVVQSGVTQPFMVIQHDQGSCSDADCRAFQNEVHTLLRTVPKGAGYSLSVKNTEHFNFSDYGAYFSLLRPFGVLGSIDGQHGIQITRTYVRAFFDTYLNSTPSALLHGPSSAYPEVQFSTP
ncbi:alpha/beta hydrolase [Dictyobacter sp. S3.2.2.5]|uniref:Alpha/beta hydrolase n=1 Tax=Dictyobacter halimunensis TaxID=3026934 RepID=A0ABQ6FMD2_9CHLR|nr:alpha/beta hydrolase [Dictyobacter sp. S3.2.2.5]